MITLRDYQRQAINSIFEYFKKDSGNPLVVLPTASGKSLVQAAFIKQVLEKYPNEKMVLLAHRKELLSQNANELLKWYPDCPLGLYSAGLKTKNIRQITIAGIQSIFKKGENLGGQSLVLIDEAHLLPKDGLGMYQTLLSDLKEINPKLKIIGLTATPFRLDSGLLHEGESRIFTDIVFEISMKELIEAGYLAQLTTKASAVQGDLSAVHIRGGEFVAEEAEEAMDKILENAVKEIIKRGIDRYSWLIFGAGIRHAHHIAERLKEFGVDAKAITGESIPMERDLAINDFKENRLRALVGCDIFTTGFNAPNIDLIALLRPTQSAGLFVQMCGRGSRLYPDKKNCLILDFAGNIKRFGPVDAIEIKHKNGKAEIGEGGFKTCPQCDADIHPRFLICPHCGYKFPLSKKELEAIPSEENILSKTEIWEVTNIEYKCHKKTDRPDSLKVTYYCGLKWVSKWVCFEHGGFAARKAKDWWKANIKNPDTDCPFSIPEVLTFIEHFKKPKKIKVWKKGKYYEILSVIEWEGDKDEEERKEIEAWFDERKINI